MFKRKLIIVLIVLLNTLTACNSTAKDITLIDKKVTSYKIILSANPTKLELRTAKVLQTYLKKASGTELKIVNEGKGILPPAIYIGDTKMGNKMRSGKLEPESYFFGTDDENIVFKGGGGKGLIYGVYSFLETYLHCRKIDTREAIVPNLPIIKIPANIEDYHKPQFEYREVYYPTVHNAEYLEWHKLHQLDDLWGLWGHSYDKLVPAKIYFKTHPEYYALVKGTRQASQLCLANPDVYKIVLSEFKKRIADNPDAMYWSLSPNDDIGYCECEKCKAIDNEEGGPQGSLIKFVNSIAEQFPDKKFATLAYGYSHRAPKKLKPAPNVYIFLSNIDAYRDKPLSEEGSAAGFRRDLKDWSALTPNIFIWDYVTEFTNYLAPFPNFNTLQANIKYLKDNGVKGIFEQGSGDTYSEFAEWRCYLLAKLLWNDTLNIKEQNQSFLNDFYGKEAAPYIEKYVNELEKERLTTKRKLDIYGNPINEWNSYLTPALIEKYADLFDKAEAASENNPVFFNRVKIARLPLEYTVLQQARFYGIEKHGIFIKGENDNWEIKPKFADKVKKFVNDCKNAGITELAEGGLTPQKYQQQWDSIFKYGVINTKAIGATVALKYPNAADFPAKGTSTLVDGNPGYEDFSYNWLCFYGTQMVATIDLGKPTKVSKLFMHFLDDPRHWIFLPEKIEAEFSTNGKDFYSVPALTNNTNEEHYNLDIKGFNIKNDKNKPIRYIRVTANPIKSLPDWRYRENKKPMIACDEIYVE